MKDRAGAREAPITHFEGELDVNQVFSVIHRQVDLAAAAYRQVKRGSADVHIDFGTIALYATPSTRRDMWAVWLRAKCGRSYFEGVVYTAWFSEYAPRIVIRANGDELKALVNDAETEAGEGCA